ncbi:MAG: AmpG family muropeptide MFS transporter [Ignavibacteria bacterium]|jgi:PAT family beta-lactamase induction signal transducer AmpG
MKKDINPWAWVSTLYYAEGLPYVIVMTVSVIMYKRLNISNTDIALYTSWLYLPWVIKPIWSPFVDIIKTKRFWIITMQVIIGTALACVALTIPADNFFRYTLAFFWLLAFSSATHDIAIDGFYMIGLSKHEQTLFVGIRSTFYRIAMITGQGLLVILAGYFEELFPGNIKHAWTITFLIIAAVFIVLFIYHRIILPKPINDKPASVNSRNIINDFVKTFSLFFKKKQIGVILGFLLLYRLGESQLVKLASPFLLDSADAGGLGLSTSEVGFVYGTVGLISLSIGGILGGYVASKKGLKYWIWWMLVAINLPNSVYIYLSSVLPDSFLIVNICVAIEQFGYGFGFTAYMLYMIYISDGDHKTSHFAIATGFMALGMMLPGMVSGWIQEQIGYQSFFMYVLLTTIPAFIITKFIDIDPKFGIKKVSNNGE